MAFTSSSGSRTYIKYAEQDDGDVLVEGFYVGEETSKFGHQVYIFKQQENGALVGLNETGKLKKWINNEVLTGDLVQIIYGGKAVMTGGKFEGKEAHQFQSLGIDLDRRARIAEMDKGITKADPTVKRKSVFATEAFNDIP